MPTALVAGPAVLDPFEAAAASRPIISSRVPSAAAAISAAAAHSLRTTASQPAVHTAAMRARPGQELNPAPGLSQVARRAQEEDSVASDARRNAVPSTNTTAAATSSATGVSDFVMCSTTFPSSHAPQRGGTRLPPLPARQAVLPGNAAKPRLVRCVQASAGDGTARRGSSRPGSVAMNRSNSSTRQPAASSGLTAGCGPGRQTRARPSSGARRGQHREHRGGSASPPPA